MAGLHLGELLLEAPQFLSVLAAHAGGAETGSEKAGSHGNGGVAAPRPAAPRRGARRRLGEAQRQDVERSPARGLVLPRRVVRPQARGWTIDTGRRFLVRKHSVRRYAVRGIAGPNTPLEAAIWRGRTADGPRPGTVAALVGCPDDDEEGPATRRPRRPGRSRSAAAPRRPRRAVADQGHLDPAITTSAITHPASEILYNGLISVDDDRKLQPEPADSGEVTEGGARPEHRGVPDQAAVRPRRPGRRGRRPDRAEPGVGRRRGRARSVPRPPSYRRPGRWPSRRSPSTAERTGVGRQPPRRSSRSPSSLVVVVQLRMVICRYSGVPTMRDMRLSVRRALRRAK